MLLALESEDETEHRVSESQEFDRDEPPAVA